MKCINHPHTVAVGICVGCQAALCPECLCGNQETLCANCVIAHNNRLTLHLGKQLGVSALLLVGTIVVLQDRGLSWDSMLAGALMAAFLPFGWSALSRFFSPGDDYLHPITRLVSLAVHLAVSALVGWLVGPWQIYKAVREIVKARSVNRSLTQAAPAEATTSSTR